MATTLACFIEGLKKRLTNNQEHYCRGVCGDSESGFEITQEFDFDALMREIDQFSAEFERRKDA